MEMLTRDQEAVIRNLVLLAEGDSQLVEIAFRDSAAKNGAARLRDVMTRIKASVKHRHDSGDRAKPVADHNSDLPTAHNGI